jgi:hypothetical protein
MGCYIPPNNLSTLRTVKQAWIKCPQKHTPILLGNLNINPRAPKDKRDERISKVVKDITGLVDKSKHFRQRSRKTTWGRWMWRIRRGKRWMISQCDYFLGRATNRRKFCSVQLHTPNHHDRIIVQSSPNFAWGMWQRWWPIGNKWPNSQSNSPLALKMSFVLSLRSFESMLWYHPNGCNHITLGFLPPHGGTH